MGCGVSVEDNSELAILEIGELLHDATREGARAPDVAMEKIREAEARLPRVDAESQEHYTILIHTREGQIHFKLRRYPQAVEAYSLAVHLAEQKIQNRERGLYSLLQRYAECMCDIARIWRQAASSARARRRRLREQSKAELALLRCVEMIEEGHNRRSDLLVEPLMMLAKIYEELTLIASAERCASRACGILVMSYGHDHPMIRDTMAYMEHLAAKRALMAQAEAAVVIQSVVRMYLEMRHFSHRIGRRATRHELLPPRSASQHDAATTSGCSSSRQLKEGAPPTLGEFLEYVPPSLLHGSSSLPGSVGRFSAGAGPPPASGRSRRSDSGSEAELSERQSVTEGLMFQSLSATPSFKARQVGGGANPLGGLGGRRASDTPKAQQGGLAEPILAPAPLLQRMWTVDPDERDFEGAEE